MATVEENREAWSHWSWSQGGDEWSVAWGGTEYMWWGAIFPRIQAFVPTGSILEIAPGFGRCTHYLQNLCRKLVIVDLTERCIAACRERFAASSHIHYYVNDGKSLKMIADNSIDVVFSWDSLVHAEHDVLQTYLAQLARKLKPDGVGFIHHSNLGAYKDAQTGELRVENPHWRATSMTAKLFEEYCDEVGLQCLAQEVIAWGGTVLNDCFSLFAHKAASFVRPIRVVENKDFSCNEINRLATLAKLFNPRKFPCEGE
ncbi:MAG: class I SAM-dependent methyltransferase [Candidatus Binatia bacterium]